MSDTETEGFVNNTIFSFYAGKEEIQFKQPIVEIEQEIDTQLKRNSANISSLLIKAQILYKYHLKFNEALKLIRNVLEIDGNNIDGRIDIVQIYILKKEKHSEQVQALLDECFLLDKSYWRTYYIQCVLYFHTDKIDMGLNIINESNLYIPYSHWIDSIKAQILSDRKKGNDLKESKIMVDRILKEQPKDFEIMIRLAYTYINLQKFDITEQLLIKALLLNPNSAKGCNNYSYLLRVNKNYEKSIELSEIAVKLDTEYLDAYYNMACSYYNLGQYENSAKFYKKCVQIDRKRLGSYQELSFLYMEMIKDERMASYYVSKFLRLFPHDEYGNNLNFLHKFRLLCENKSVDIEEAETTQFSNINRIQKQGSSYEFITYSSSQQTLNYLYNE